jgi:hypothetical protein
VHVVADTHETPYNRLALAIDGFGVVWTAQLLPFHPSASVTVMFDELV